MTEFKVGDKVKAFGVGGVVVDTDDTELPICCKFGKEEIAFRADGKYYQWAKEPSLVLIDRPKKMVKKTMWKRVTKISRDNNALCIIGNLYESQEEAWSSKQPPFTPDAIGVSPVEVEIYE